MRITDNTLSLSVQLLNKTTGHPAKIFKKTDKGCKYHVGCYSVEQNYKFYNLVQTVHESGGQAVLTTGTKADIIAYINAYLRGWSDARETK